MPVSSSWFNYPSSSFPGLIILSPWFIFVSSQLFDFTGRLIFYTEFYSIRFRDNFSRHKNQTFPPSTCDKSSGEKRSKQTNKKTLTDSNQTTIEGSQKCTVLSPKHYSRQRRLSEAPFVKAAPMLISFAIPTSSIIKYIWR